MFSDIYHLSIDQQIEVLTRELIKMESYSGTDGENIKAEWIVTLIQSFPYFKANPQLVWEQDIDEDDLKRKNVFAFIKSNGVSKNTVIFHAHHDTVGTQDFGPLQSIAHNPDALETYFRQYDADPELLSDARSGEWLFGRGAFDMQSGIAVHLSNLLYFSENLEKLNGNILVMFNPDEESQHTGIRGALKELLRLKEEYSLHYVAAINNDVVSPLYEGDLNKYIYTGTAGKVLPCFSIFGREAHVGDSLSGIDPTLIASELNIKIAQNFELVEKMTDELVLPPTCLYLRDDKKSYDVQTAVNCKLYFNYFLYERSPKQIMDELLAIAMDSCSNVEARQRQNYQQFIKANGLPERAMDWSIEVTSLENFIRKLELLGFSPYDEMKKVIVRLGTADMDARELAFQMVEALHYLDPEKKPRVILFYAPPFLPSNYLQEESKKGKAIYENIKKVLEEEALISKESFKLRRYFPYLSDGSFLSYIGTKEDIDSLKNNFPAMEQLFSVPLEAMKELNIPALNIGVFGKGAHKWTERVYKPYSFRVLPMLIQKVTVALLQE